MGRAVLLAFHTGLDWRCTAGDCETATSKTGSLSTVPGDLPILGEQGPWREGMLEARLTQEFNFVFSSINLSLKFQNC
ncbi:MAG: hypothetical protein M1483_04185 [Actinobacteria bacterium]|nr:hypothetical protein [Actinomycetota bacterium]